MPYTDQAALEIAAGGTAALIELTDINHDGVADWTAIAQAQAEADSWIDGYARRLYGEQLPFDPVPAAIRAMAAAETVYRLRSYRRVLSDSDHQLRAERDATMTSLESGQWNPVEGDTYPIGDGGGTPTAVERTTTSTSADVVHDFGRDGLKGYW